MKHAETTPKSRYLQLLRNTTAENYAQAGTNADTWLDDNVRKARSSVFSLITKITPDIAKAILRRNDGNRSVNVHHVVRIAHDIENGLWKLNGEAIIISETGMLNDGQHRLHACIAADTPFETLIVFGTKRDTRFTVDMGRARTSGNFLAMEGITNANNIASVSKALLIYSRGVYTNADHVSGTKQEVIQFYHENRDGIDTAMAAVYGKKFSRTVNVTAITACYFILHRVNPRACEEFFTGLIEGEGLRKGSPILQARSHLIEAKQGRNYVWEKMELILRYWNAWRLHKQVTRNIPLRREWPEVEA